jgi:hypothetical protein
MRLSLGDLSCTDCAASLGIGRVVGSGAVYGGAPAVADGSGPT